MSVLDVENADALYALYYVLAQHMPGDPLWLTRCSPDPVPAGMARPYVVWFEAGGGEDNFTIQPDATIMLTVKCVADELSSAMQGAARISAKLNDFGLYDANALTVQHPYWIIQTITQGRRVHQVEMFENASPVYHSGHQFEFVMARV